MVSSSPEKRKRTRTGRPAKLTRPLMEEMYRGLRMFQPISVAAGTAGLYAETVVDWIKEGARLEKGMQGAQGFTPVDPSTLTRDQKLLVEFSRGVNEALAEAEGRLAAVLAGAVYQPSVETRTTTKIVGRTDDGLPIYGEETTRIERPPDARLASEILRSRFGKNWQPKQAVEVSGPDGGPIPIEAARESLREKVAQYRQAAVGGLRALPPAPEADDEGAEPG